MGMIIFIFMHVQTSIIQLMEKEMARYIMRYFAHLMTDDERLALQHGYYDDIEQFELTVAGRIIADTPEKVSFNNCPSCNKLARTPNARQCRYCGYSWRDNE